MKAKKKTPARRSGKKTTVEIFGRIFTKLKDGGINIDGHLLTPKQLEQFRNDLVSRFHAIKTGSDDDRVRQAFSLALDHLLWQHQPTATAGDWIGETVNDLENVASALMALRKYPFYLRDSAGSRGVEVLKLLRGDLNRVSDGLTHLHTAMIGEREGLLKLQDMISQREAFEDLRAVGRTEQPGGKS
jgi:hypothetical protein